MAEYQEVLDIVRQLSAAEREQLRCDLDELGQSPTTKTSPKQSRTPGLNRGQIEIGDDFNDPLPDEYLGLE